jgi:CheY-like chemotaxis protein
MPKKRTSTYTYNSTATISQNRILIVDDEKDIATLFKLSLEDNGFLVDVFYDPVVALSEYKAGF